jgi:DNA-binding protein H-NS
MARRPKLKLDGMSLAELRQLHDEVQTALSGKIQMEREELQHKIDELSALETSVAGDGGKGLLSTQRTAGPRSRRVATGSGIGKAHPLKGRTVAPKYRDPNYPGQTWAGRGQAPRWLTAYESQGRKREEFLIGATADARSKGRRGGRKGKGRTSRREQLG